MEPQNIFRLPFPSLYFIYAFKLLCPFLRGTPLHYLSSFSQFIGLLSSFVCPSIRVSGNVSNIVWPSLVRGQSSPRTFYTDERDARALLLPRSRSLATLLPRYVAGITEFWLRRCPGPHGCPHQRRSFYFRCRLI